MFTAKIFNVLYTQHKVERIRNAFMLHNECSNVNPVGSMLVRKTYSNYFYYHRTKIVYKTFNCGSFNEKYLIEYEEVSLKECKLQYKSCAHD